MHVFMHLFYNDVVIKSVGMSSEFLCASFTGCMRGTLPLHCIVLCCTAFVIQAPAV